MEEPTSRLDRQTAQVIEKRLLALEELTLLMISHHLSTEAKEAFDGVLDLS